MHKFPKISTLVYIYTKLSVDWSHFGGVNQDWDKFLYCSFRFQFDLSKNNLFSWRFKRHAFEDFSDQKIFEDYSSK